jgi:cysteine synthase B
MNGPALQPGRASGLLAAIGSTPLVEIECLAGLPRGTRLFGKLESVHPGGSIKDRPVARMLDAALRERRFEDGRRLLDASSGNAGIAYAQLGASLGIGVTLVVPGNASRERLERMRSHGAELVLTDPLEGYDHALREAARLAREHPQRYWHCDQYANAENWRAHLRTTGPEILSQCTALLGHAPAAFVCGVGTGGTLTGVGRALRDARPDTFLGCVIPERFPGIEGLKPLGAADDIVPPILDQSLIDARLAVTHEQAIETSRELARCGLFVGPSSGAFVHAAVHFARERELDSVVVPLCDSGERYGSTGLWNVAV